MGFGWGTVAQVFGGVGGSLLGADAQRKSDTKAREQQQRQFDENIRQQREFAQMGVQWRVQDAVSAGLHPLAGLGMSGSSFTPGQTPDTRSFSEYDHYRNIGQDLGRAISSTRTKEERAFEQAKLENAFLQNDLLRAQISTISNASNPGFPSSDGRYPVSGQGDSIGLVDSQPDRSTVTYRDAPYQEAGFPGDVKFYATRGGAVPQIPQQLSESFESDAVGRWLWNLRNRISPNLEKGNLNVQKPAKSSLPKGAHQWVWDSTSQQWMPDFYKVKMKFKDYRVKPFMGRSYGEPASRGKWRKPTIVRWFDTYIRGK